MEINIQIKNVQKQEDRLSTSEFQQVIGLALWSSCRLSGSALWSSKAPASDRAQHFGVPAGDRAQLSFKEVIGLSVLEFQQIIGLSTSEFQQVIGLSTSEFQQVIGLSAPSTRCVCVGNPNYNGSVRLQYTAGGAGDTDESGTNKGAHQLSVIWQKDASATYLLRTCDAIVVQAVYAGHHVISSLCK